MAWELTASATTTSLIQTNNMYQIEVDFLVNLFDTTQ